MKKNHLFSFFLLFTILNQINFTQAFAQESSIGKFFNPGSLTKGQYEFQGQKVETSFFVGADVNQSYAKQAISVQASDDKLGGITDFTENKSSNRARNFGLNAGYNMLVNKIIYIAPEVFFDQLNNSIIDPYGNPNGESDRRFTHQNDRLILNYRYGAKLNLGFRIQDKFNIYANAGLTNISYKVNWNSNLDAVYNNQSYGAMKLAMIYGLGASYDINDRWSVKTSYDHQRFNVRYNFDGWRSRVQLNTFKLGLAFNF